MIGWLSMFAMLIVMGGDLGCHVLYQFGITGRGQFDR
jgi:hypothetical protein